MAPPTMCSFLGKVRKCPYSAVGGQSSIPLPTASVVNVWTASTSEHSSSPTLLSSLEIHAQNCQLSKWCWLHSHMRREGRGRDFSREQLQWQQKNHLKKNISVSNYHLVTSPWVCSILFQYSNTEPSFIVSRTLQSKTSSWLNSKEKLFHLWSGSNKSSDAKGKRSAWGLSVLVLSTSTHTSSFVRSQEFQARRFFWNLTELGHRETNTSLKQETQIFSWMILTLFQGPLLRCRRPEFCLSQGQVWFWKHLRKDTASIICIHKWEEQEA